ncbi:MogA/MoaB family molybdenum cofactor biosynthesis protein [Planctomycetota bacterium]
MIKVAILTVSDTCSKGQRPDLSGPILKDALDAKIYQVCDYKVVPDNHESIAKELTRFADEKKLDIVLTTGGTGLGPRDVTPEATAEISSKMVPGLAEIIRREGLKKTRNALLSRAVAGIRGGTLIINLPGSPKGAKESIEAIMDVLPHAKKMMQGQGHD